MTGTRSIAFLSARATPGVESRGSIRVSPHHRHQRQGRIDRDRAGGRVAGAVTLEVRFPDPNLLLSIVERAKRMFDVAADPAVIAEQLSVDPLVEARLFGARRHPRARRVGSVRARGSRHPRTADLRPRRHHHRRARGRAMGIAGGGGCRVSTGSFPPPAQLQDAPIEDAGVIASTSRRHSRARARGVQTARSCSMRPSCR